MGSGKRRRLRTALLPLQGPIKPRWASLRLALQNVQGPGSWISQELVDASWKVVVLPGGSLVAGAAAAAAAAAACEVTGRGVSGRGANG